MPTRKHRLLIAVLLMTVALIAGVVGSSSARAGEISHGLARSHVVSGPAA